MLGVLAQRTALLVMGASLLLVVGLGGTLALLVLLPLVGTLGTLAGTQDLTALLGDLPRLVSTHLVEVPKAVLDYLAPLLQFKSALEGKA